MEVDVSSIGLYSEFVIASYTFALSILGFITIKTVLAYKRSLKTLEILGNTRRNIKK